MNGISLARSSVSLVALLATLSSSIASAPARAASASLAQWLAGQRVNTCFPWFLSGIGDTLVPFDPAKINHAINTDEFNDGNILFAATIQAAGSDSLRVQYDAEHKLALFDHRSGELREEYLLADVGAPPTAVTSSDLRGIRTAKGVRLGASLSATAATAGVAKPRIVRRCGYEAIVVQSSGAECTNERDFIFKDRKLVAFGVGGNC